MQGDALPVGPGAVLLAVLALLLVMTVAVVLARRRSTARVGSTDDDAEPFEPGAFGGDPADETAEPATPEPDLPPGVLNAYVRTLEETLAEQDERLHEVRARGDRLLAEARQRQAQRVQCTLLAIRERVADQPGEVVMNRVEAALARLGDGPGTARPPLARAPSGSLPVAFAAPFEGREGRSPLAPEPQALPAPTYLVPVDPVPVEPEPADPEPFHLQSGGPAPDPADDASTVTTPQRVLPVPAPPQAAVSSRPRRRFGRSRVS